MKIMKVMRAALLLAAAAALGFGVGWKLAPRSAVVTAVQAVQADVLEEFRTERQQLRAMQRAELNDIIHSPDVEADIAGMAQRRLMEISGEEEAETKLEGMLRLRGWEDCIVSISGESVNVLLRAELVTRQDSSVILELACRETGAQSGNVKIIPIK